MGILEERNGISEKGIGWGMGSKWIGRGRKRRGRQEIREERVLQKQGMGLGRKEWSGERVVRFLVREGKKEKE